MFSIDLRGLFVCALVGAVAIGATVLVGAPALAWLIYEHVSIH